MLLTISTHKAIGDVAAALPAAVEAHHFGVMQVHNLKETMAKKGVELARIAALGITFYLIMDIAIHWGVLRHLRKEVDANPVIPVMAIVLDLVVFSGFLWVKVDSDPLILIVAAAVMAAILITEFFFLRTRPSDEHPEHSHSGCCLPAYR